MFKSSSMEFPTKAEFSKQLLSLLVSEAVLLSEEGVSVGDGVEVGCVVGSTVGATED